MRKFIACIMALCVMFCSVPVVAEEALPTENETVTEEVSAVEETPVTVEEDSEEAETSAAEEPVEEDSEEAEPSATEEPVEEAEPSATEEPAEEAEPSATEEPAVEVEVPATEEPAVEAEISTIEEDSTAADENSDFVIEDAVLVEYVGEETEVIVPEEVTEIGEEAFAGNEVIESVHFAGEVVKIGVSAFEGCINLEEVSFADISMLEEIESKAFAACEKLDTEWVDEAEEADIADDAFDVVIEETEAEGAPAEEISDELEITSQPQSVSLAVGETAEFTVAATGEELSYRWYILKPTSETWAVTNMTGCRTETLSIAATLERNGYQYRCVITDANGNTVTSDAATLTVTDSTALEITSQPESVSLAVGETAEFTVAATGDGLSYRWYILKPGSETWAVTSMPGNRTDTLSIAVTLERNGYQYRCVVTDANGNTVTSDAATLTVTDATAFEITSQPQSVSLAVGETAQFTVAANGDGLSYRWYILKPTSTTWAVTGMPGYKTDTLSVEATLERNGYQYRCVVTDANGNTVTSEAATLTVTDAAALEITSQPQSVSLAVGETAQFTVAANGDGLSYRWYILKPTSTTWAVTGMTGCKTDTLSVEATLERNGYQYRCIVTDANGNTVTSDAATLTVTDAAALEITSQPQSVSLAVGETAEFTVAATGDGLSYRWYILKPGSETWAVTSMPGNRTETLSIEVTLERNGYQYRCIVTDANGNTVTSEAATLTVTDSVAFEITSQPQSVELAVGETAEFTVAATGDGLTYRWYILKPGSETWAVTSMPGNRTETLSIEVTLERDGYQYRCVVTDANGNQITSEAAMLTVVSNITLDDVVYEKTSDTTVSVKAYTGSAAAVVIPETVEGYTVTAIGESAFEGNTALTSINLPDTIQVIGARAFANCTSLSQMN